MRPDRWRQIEAIYHAALEREADRRVSFLDEACAGDQLLRREVEELLAATEQAGSFLSTIALEHEARAMAEEITLSPVLQQLSHYQVLSRIGAGGMGEVWLARDSILERQVALKILPAQFTADAQRLHRFTREARAASALNHPNIITIYEIGQVGGTHFIATEFIEGRTLRQLLGDGRFDLRETLEVSIQIAAALDTAHKAGIVHRDIKPENIMVRPDRLVKVLDFGLAKLTEPQTPSEAGSGESSTAQGIVIGTPRYMSPEQARGQKVDARTDIFSFGAVLYEMITGEPPFKGETAADLFAVILTAEPQPLSQNAPDAPAELERILRKALAKDSRDRYQSVRDLQIDLQMLRQDSESNAAARQHLSGSSAVAQAPASSIAAPAAKRWRVAGAAMIALLIAAATWFGLNRPGESFRLSDLRLTELTSLRISVGSNLSRLSFSPDGKLIAYSLGGMEGSHLWIMQLIGGQPKRVTDSEWNASNPVWSPDGQQLAFVSNRGGSPGIWSVSYLGGAPKLLGELPATDSSQKILTAWSKDGQTIYFESGAGLSALDPGSGRIASVIGSDSAVKNASGFRISPDEKQIAYSASINGRSQIFVRPVGAGEPRQLTYGEGHNRYPDWFPDSRRLAFSSSSSESYQIRVAWTDAREPVQLTLGNDDYQSVSVSPDGRTIIAVSTKENAGIFACDPVTGAETVWTSDPGLQLFPEIAPDGRMIAFQSSRAIVRMSETIFVKTRNTDEPIELASPGFDAKWSPDGAALAFLRYKDGKADLWKVSISGRNETQLTTGGLTFSGMTLAPQNRLAVNYNWSPDGRRIAYCSAKSGQSNLWAINSDGTNDTMMTGYTDLALRISSPFWSSDGSRLAYALGAENVRRTICVVAQGKTTTVFQNDNPLRLLGWSVSGKDLYLALGSAGVGTIPQEITLVRASVSNGKAETLARLPAAYLHNIRISGDGRGFAFVTRQDGRDNIALVSESGQIRQLTRNIEPNVYYSGLAWAPDGRAICYSRQTGSRVVSLIEFLR
jgi:Tol biopolymer transport system component/predicted Ser/Thr protein kinase